MNANGLSIAMDCISADFGVDSLSSFPLRARTDEQTDKATVTIKCPSRAGDYAGGVGN